MISNVAGDRLYRQISDRLNDAYDRIHTSGNWIDDVYTASAENKLKAITGRKYARLTSSGTSAIQVGLLAWNIIGKKVACTNYSYVASVNQACLINSVDFYDTDQNGLMNISDKFIHDAVIPVSLYGNTLDYDKLKISDNTKVIVDCAQSLGAKYKGRPDGSFGDAAVFSFARNKPIPTAGTHGALVWDDDSMVNKVMAASINGKLGRNNPISSFGVNGTPFELQAAWIDIGLDHLTEWQIKRKQIYKFYKQAFKDLPVQIIEAGDHCESNYHKFAMRVNDRDGLHTHLHSEKIQALQHYTDSFADFFGSEKTFPVSKAICNEIITLPNHAWMTDAEVETVAEKVKSFYNE